LVDTLFTFCPPLPPLRLVLKEISVSKRFISGFINDYLSLGFFFKDKLLVDFKND
jgi:hypothetical protein